MKLSELSKNQYAKIVTVGGKGALRQHFLDMGVIPGASIEFVKLAPMGDPIEYRIHGYELTLRKDDAAQIDVELCDKKEIVESIKEPLILDHPGLGEGGKYHDKKHESPLDKDELLTFALVGNQNCGKTTLFNQITGSNQHVGNFPGVTVDKKSGAVIGHPNTEVTDLPGIYSMSPYSSEEIVSRNFVLQQKPKAIINIVDATNMERNLYLTMQLLEMGIPMVIALNMMDEMTSNGGSVNVNVMESMLGVPVIPISAAKGQGIHELIEHAIHVAYYQEKPARQDFCDENDHNGAVHRCLHAVIHLIQDHAKAADLPLRFAASKVIEGDHLIREALKLDDNENATLNHIIKQLELERGLDHSASIAEMRFLFIARVCENALVKPKVSKQHVRSSRIDRILTGKYTGIPAFLIIMITIFYLTFNVIGAYFQELLEVGVENVTLIVEKLLIASNVNGTISDLIINGIFQGVGSVISFLPIIVVLFFFLSLLEDSGYIARVAFVMDKPLQKLGLSGRSIVPLLIGFGCTVPAVMSTRTLPSKRDRKMTILLTPFMSCTAKLPIYAFFVNAFFKGHKGFIMTALYVTGVLLAILVAFLFKKTIFKGEAVPFVMELPNYRLPGAKNVGLLMWDKAKDFIQKAFSVILVATVLVWFLQTFNFSLNVVSDSKESMMATISSGLVPIFKPIGLGDWRIVTSLISGVMAKESVVSTMEILFASSGGVSAAITTATAASMIVFSLIYSPCIAAIAAIKRELGWLWAVGVIFWQCFVAWCCSFIVYAIFIL